ncbi:MFS transporter, partial [Brevibacterium paucivorans]
GMALGLIVYMTGRKNLPADSRKTVNPLPRNKLWVLPAAVVAVGLAIWAVVAL